jgi:hypothetical protein
LDLLQCWMLVELVEEVSNDFSEELENNVAEVYAAMQACGLKLQLTAIRGG